ncbi:transcriptional regulator, TetR family [Leptospira fainei serovar Hurstbridge str. BUT 6]|uniref:Transcriptional regulator, TetR family n=1 Tax=Leptospira fainei serovar Hurstbridge str. BUT 6 TaxID=1193011 RepID=S3V2T0_9LEPT|nr:TetR/AcrR family transcriptional regulator [Leptospira fainei]EPG74939.1 transcriptional regulator, TetR family [Leptospira fainei serovar Hurstbridge str. BUT 6]
MEKKRKTKKGPWLPQAERIRSIIQAALPLFAQRGFDGASTRSLSKSAGISEGLIYRYFHRKRDLFEAVLQYCLKLSDPFRVPVSDLEPGSETFVFLINTFLLEIFFKCKNEEMELTHKLILRSLSTDGKFARKYFRNKFRNLFPLMKISLEACVKKKELPPDRSWKTWRDVNWIIRHLLVVFYFFNFSFSKHKLFQDRTESLRLESIRFFLLGVGFLPDSTEILLKKVTKQSVLVM